MAFRLLDLLLPREQAFFKYMNEQTDILHKGCEAFQRFVTDLEKMSEDERKAAITEIKDLENKGDEVEHFIIDKLHKTFITPIDREDIHSMAINIDKSLDILNSTALKIDLYGVKKTSDNVKKFAYILVQCASNLQELFKCLEAKKDINEINVIISNMHRLENDADHLFRATMADLFNNEKDAIKIIKFKEIYEQLENNVDTFDFIAKLVRGILVKQG